jgi:hypothetical protein
MLENAIPSADKMIELATAQALKKSFFRHDFKHHVSCDMCSNLPQKDRIEE